MATAAWLAKVVVMAWTMPITAYYAQCDHAKADRNRETVSAE
jgi:hypothetical protein